MPSYILLSSYTSILTVYLTSAEYNFMPRVTPKNFYDGVYDGKPPPPKQKKTRKRKRNATRSTETTTDIVDRFVIGSRTTDMQSL